MLELKGMLVSSKLIGRMLMPLIPIGRGIVVQRGCVNRLPGQREVPGPPQGVVQEELQQERRGGGATAGSSEEEAGHGGRPGQPHGTLCPITG